jgi:hypothetical protein
VKWTAILVGLIALLVAGWLFREEIRKFLAELRAWWASLFAARDAGSPAKQAISLESPGRPRRRFAGLPNPFRDGRHQRLSADQLARESFVALEALAGEMGADRPDDSTPQEFAETIAGKCSPLAAAARQLASVYNAVAYGTGRLSASQVSQLREAWQQMEQFAAREFGHRATPAG